MKKRISVLVLVLIMITLSACGGTSAGGEASSQVVIEKDVTMLLKGLGDSLDMVKSLGNLPEAQVNGNLHYFQNANTEGYFAGFDLGIELEADGQTVKQIYIQPVGNAKITANGLVIGGTIADAKASLGDGELSSVENNGKIVNFMTFSDQTYAMKATVAEERITAVAFTQSTGESDSAAVTEAPVEAKVDVEAPAEPTAETDEKTPEAGSFDFLLAFLGQDFSEVEAELGSDFDRVEEAYEDLAFYKEDGFVITFSIDFDSNAVTTVAIGYDSLATELDGEMSLDLCGLSLGMHAKDVAYNQTVYGDYAIYVAADCNNVVYNIQALNMYPDFVFEAPRVTENPADDGYELSIQNFDTYSILSLTYNSTGETKELVNTKGRWDGDRFFDGMNVKILKTKASKDGKTVYFETDDPKMTNGYGAANNTILKYDLQAGYEENVCLGFLHDTVKLDGYEDCIIINYYEPNPRGGYYEPFILIDGETNYHFMGIKLETDLASQIERAYHDEIDEHAMDPLKAETIYGKYVDFSKYSAVVVEDYQGINKDKFVSKITIQNPYYKDTADTLYPCYFAVFGTIYNLRWEVSVNMDESHVYPIADKLSDTFVTYETWRPYDPSVDSFLFEDENGKEYRINIEDMSDNIDLVMIP
ncbi:hypothetical protein SANA_11660 [Gottschalkiaceae bacterium SANA]|nr:hypothetical protein SANA_11660 [Gottschalkiaceae bacterium SANA]